MRRFLPLFVIIVGSILFILANSTVRGFCSEITYPFRRISGWMWSQVSDRVEASWRGLCDGTMRFESEVELERLRVMLNETEALANENAALREALEWKKRQPFRTIAAPVWSYGGGLGVWPRLTLGAGAKHGISAGDAVVVPEGLVGRVAPGVTTHTCEVILLSDTGCRVAAEIPGVTKGIIQGCGGEDFGVFEDEDLLYQGHPLIMRFVGRDVELADGQEIVTEGSGGVFPRGIIIGRVLNRQSDGSGLLTEVLVEPAVDSTLLDTVFVLTARPGGAE